MIQFQKSDIQKRMKKPDNKLTLQKKMILMIGLLIIAVILVIGLFVNHFTADSLEVQLGEQAMAVADSIALNPEIAEAFADENPAAIIQPLVSPVQQATNAEFIVVGNTDEIRYSHPNPEQIGRKMVGEDNSRALEYGEAYISKATGSLGNSMRAKVPVYRGNEIIGVVSVGFLTDDIPTLTGDYKMELWLMLFVIAAVALLVSNGIASYIKRMLHGLEPEEISHLLFQKETILQSTHEGIIAVNGNGEITLLNQMAQHLLFHNTDDAESLVGQPIQRLFPSSDLLEILETRESHFDREYMYGDQAVYVNSRPIIYEDSLVGAVSTFRYKTEIDKLTKELSSVKQYANALRAQTHEFANKLYTISGLLYLDRKEDALEFIRLEQDVQQESIRQLIEKVSDPLISGILIGKMSQANELQIQLMIDPESQLSSILSDPQKQALLSAIGNLLDNAMDAVKSQSPANRRISLYFTDLGEDILFEIDDSGSGVPPEKVNHLFIEGYSSKPGSDRGYGLSTTQRLIMLAGGDIHIEESEFGGACFVVSLPKEVLVK